MQMESILYNKAVVKKEPKNLKELEKLFADLKKQGITPLHVDGRDGWYLNQVLHEAVLAGMTSDDWAQKVVAGEACFTDDVYVNAWETFKSWQDKGYMNATPLADDYGAMRTGVALGTSAMMIDGIWSATPASPMFEIDPSLELGYMAVPGKNNKVYGFMVIFLITRTAKSKTQSRKFLSSTQLKNSLNCLLKKWKQFQLLHTKSLLIMTA